MRLYKLIYPNCRGTCVYNYIWSSCFFFLSDSLLFVYFEKINLGCNCLNGFSLFCTEGVAMGGGW